MKSLSSSAGCPRGVALLTNHEAGAGCSRTCTYVPSTKLFNWISSLQDNPVQPRQHDLGGLATMSCRQAASACQWSHATDNACGCACDLEADVKVQSQCSRASTATCIPYPRTLPSWQVCRDPSVSAMSCLVNSQGSGRTPSLRHHQ